MSIITDLASLDWTDWLKSIIGAGITAAAQTLAAPPLASMMGAQPFSPRQLAIMAGAAAVAAMAAILKKSPLPDRKVAIALLSGVHTQEDVAAIVKATASGTVPSAAVAAAILGKPTLPPLSSTPEQHEFTSDNLERI